MVIISFKKRAKLLIAAQKDPRQSPVNRVPRVKVLTLVKRMCEFCEVII
jgi:hypothetical protein